MAEITENAQKIFETGRELLASGKLAQIDEATFSTSPTSGLRTGERVVRAYSTHIPLVEVEFGSYERHELEDLGITDDELISGLWIRRVRVAGESLLLNKGNDDAAPIVYSACIWGPWQPGSSNLHVGALMLTQEFNHDGKDVKSWGDYESHGNFSPHASVVFERLLSSAGLMTSLAQHGEVIHGHAPDTN